MVQVIPARLDFEKSGPFFEMIGAFMSAVVGLESVASPQNPLRYTADQAVVFEGKVHRELRFVAYDVWQKHQVGELTTSVVVASLCQMLVNTAYETVKDHDDRSPLFEFFRHVRNACSHRNRFYFKPWEPARPAEWRGLPIDSSIRGTGHPLFGRECFLDVLRPADAPLLLWNIERHLDAS